jgi:hypothetical protein
MECFKTPPGQIVDTSDFADMSHSLPPLLHLQIPPVDFYPVADATSCKEVVTQAEKMITDRFLSDLAQSPQLRPIVHIVKSEVSAVDTPLIFDSFIHSVSQ